MFEPRSYYDFTDEGKPSIIECPTRDVERAHNRFFLDQLSVFHLLACSASMCRSCLPFVRRSARMDSAWNSSAIAWRAILDVCSCAAADAPEHCMEYFLRDEVVPIQGGMYADFEADVMGDDLGSALHESGKPYHELPPCA